MRTTYAHDGLVFDLRDEGPRDGDPVVLLHGFPQRASCWDAVVPRLHEQGLRTLAPDQRGYSRGARPFGRWSYRLPSLVEDVVALVERVGRPVHLVGHDWGAVVGWALAASRPELVRTLTAVSVPHPRAFTAAMRSPEQLVRSSYVGLFNVPFLVEGLAKARTEALDPALRRAGMTSEQIDRFHREMVEDGALPGGLAWYRALPLSGVGTGEWMRPVEAPTTFVWSDGDVAITRQAAERCGEHVRGDYRFVELDATHWIPEQAAGELADAVLDRVAPA